MKVNPTPAYNLTVGDIIFDLNPLSQFSEIEASCFEVMEIIPKYKLIRLKQISGPSYRYSKVKGIIPVPICDSIWYVVELENVDVS